MLKIGAKMADKNDETIEAEIIDEKHNIKRNNFNKGLNGWAFWGLILIFLGIMFFLQNYFRIDVWNYFWPFLLILIGLLLVFKSSRK
jgi:fatty acid desaturase